MESPPDRANESGVPIYEIAIVAALIRQVSAGRANGYVGTRPALTASTAHSASSEGKSLGARMKFVSWPPTVAR
jgi:hypothetical protein